MEDRSFTSVGSELLVDSWILVVSCHLFTGFTEDEEGEENSVHDRSLMKLRILLFCWTQICENTDIVEETCQLYHAESDGEVLN